jgi:DNA-binding GntR family transcriptional regulator
VDSRRSPGRRQNLPQAASKTAAAYEEIRDDIVRGAFPPGTRLSEVTLAERYEQHAMSRTPIREALIRLEQDGLIERRGNSAWVRERSPEEVVDICQATAFLEGAIAYCAAERRTETDLARLDAALRQAETMEAATVEDMQSANQVFHDALAKACRNAPLQEVQTRLAWQVARFPSTTLGYPGRWEIVRKEHVAIVDAVRARDPAEAERKAREHMQAAIDVRLILMASATDAAPRRFRPV